MYTDVCILAKSVLAYDKAKLNVSTLLAFAIFFEIKLFK